MAPILGKPMIGHVHDRIVNCPMATVVLLRPAMMIHGYITSIGGKAVMTSSSHERASDRCAEALGYIESEPEYKFDVVVMVQGDEPTTNSDMITKALGPMKRNSEVVVVNLLGEIGSMAEFEDRNCIKVVTDQNSDALYFSRESIPTVSRTDAIPMKKHLCYTVQTRFLEYNAMEPTPLDC